VAVSRLREGAQFWCVLVLLALCVSLRSFRDAFRALLTSTFTPLN